MTLKPDDCDLKPVISLIFSLHIDTKLSSMGSFFTVVQ